MGSLNEALQAFEKLHSIIPNSPEVIYQIANLYDLLLNFRQSTKWFNILITRVPTDPHVLSRLGQIFNKDDDESQAFHYHYESYRYYPVNLDVISWLVSDTLVEAERGKPVTRAPSAFAVTDCDGP